MKRNNIIYLFNILMLCLVFQTSFAQKKVKKEISGEELANIQGHGGAYADNDPRSLIKDEKVLNNLDEWQTLKFGFMVHWGIYSQWGSIESWVLDNDPSRNRDWGRPKLKAWEEANKDIDVFRKNYWNLNKTFNPVKFNPEKWAELADKAGMKYFVFTTMHHDGFNMFDSKYSNYKITSKEVPYHTNKNADVTKSLFNSFREKGFKIGAYYSKPSWKHKDYWIKENKIVNRNANYDVSKNPKRWKKFTKFTQNNINQLMSDYGKIDILWLDGGWVNAKNRNQGVNMDKIAKHGRRKQPGLIVVDRTIHGPNENYITPEQRIPEEPIFYPWETCMTMGKMWSYNDNDTFKPTSQVINMLVDVVAKGGNFLLNLGASPEGWFHPTAVKQMEEIGAWMKINGTAIHYTKPVAPFRAGKFGYTQNKNGDVNAIYLLEKHEKLPQLLEITDFNDTKNVKSVELLGYGEISTFNIINGKLQLRIPGEAMQTIYKSQACVFRIKK